MEENKMFIRKEEYKNLIMRINKLEENQVGKNELYKFYLERKLEEINSKLKHEIKYEVKEVNILVKILTITLGTKVIKEIHLHGLYVEPEKKVLHYLDSKSINYFKRIDRKITEAEKEVDKLLENIK